jgi:hypothetical protein
MIKGIGSVYARKLVQAFGEAVFDTIEETPERLREVAGIEVRIFKTYGARAVLRVAAAGSG